MNPKPCALTFEIDTYGRLIISVTPGWESVVQHSILSFPNFMLIWCRQSGYWCVKPEMVGALTDSYIILNGGLKHPDTKAWMWDQYVYYDEMAYLKQHKTMTWIGGEKIEAKDVSTISLADRGVIMEDEHGTD